MRRLLFIFSILLFCITASDAQQEKTVGIRYSTSDPSGPPSRQGAEYHINMTTGIEWRWHLDSLAWTPVGASLQNTETYGAPTWTPNGPLGPFAVNIGDSLYHYRDGEWHLMAGSIGPAGPQGPAGNNGEAGISVDSTYVVGDSLYFRFSDLTIWGGFYVKGPPGDDGDTGPAGNDGVSLDSIYIVGDSLYYRLSDNTIYGGFYITGPPGDEGPAGNDGGDGSDGISVDSTYMVGDSLYVRLSDMTVYGGFYVRGPAGSNGSDGDDGEDGISVDSTYMVGDSLYVRLSDMTVYGGFYVRGPAGSNGSDGDDGDDGVGVPAGGTTGQVLAKATGTDYDTEWVDQSGGGGGGGMEMIPITMHYGGAHGSSKGSGQVWVYPLQAGPLQLGAQAVALSTFDVDSTVTVSFFNKQYGWRPIVDDIDSTYISICLQTNGAVASGVWEFHLLHITEANLKNPVTNALTSIGKIDLNLGGGTWIIEKWIPVPVARTDALYLGMWNNSATTPSQCRWSVNMYGAKN